MTALIRPKTPDPLDRVLDRVSEEWLFVCPSGEIANAVAQIGQYGLNTEVYSPKTIRRIAQGQKIVVVAPGGGPGRRQALEVMAACRAAGAAVVREWCLLGLGVEFPDFASWSGTFDLANCLWCERPWLDGSAPGDDPEPFSRFSRTTYTDDEAPITLPEWPAPPEETAYHGLPGAIVRAIEPHSEADPAALLAQLLVAFGSIIGRNAHIRVGATWHHANEFALIVGESSAARKGTSWSEVYRFVGRGRSRVEGPTHPGRAVHRRRPDLPRPRPSGGKRGDPGQEQDHRLPGCDPGPRGLGQTAAGDRDRVRRRPQGLRPRREQPLGRDPPGMGRIDAGQHDQVVPVPGHRCPCLDHRAHHRR